MTLFGHKICGGTKFFCNTFSRYFRFRLFSNYKAKFNFNLKTLIINNEQYPFYQNNNKLFEPDFNRIININTNKDNFLPFVDMVYSNKQYGRFLIEYGFRNKFN